MSNVLPFEKARRRVEQEDRRRRNIKADNERIIKRFLKSKGRNRPQEGA